ncbi:MAG: hypothetical protein V1702_02060 [Candidatus Woesearchaeota archaeon]
MMNNKIIFGVVALILIIAIAGCSPIQPRQTEKWSPMEATLSLSGKPLLNTPVTLTLNFKSLANGSNTSAKIELPEGFELVSGNLEWHGNLSKNEERKIEAVVKSTKVGYTQLSGTAISIKPGYTFGDSDIIYVEVTPHDAIIGSKPENNWYDSTWIQGFAASENNEQINSELIISQNPQLNQEFTITYRVTPSIDLPDPQRTQMSLVFPPKAFKVVAVQFPDGGTTYKRDTQLSWRGSINKDQTVEIKATFKIIDTGWGSVRGGLNVQQPSGGINFIQDTKIAELYLDKYTGNYTVRAEPPIQHVTAPYSVVVQKNESYIR